ncbi:MAG TPA: HAMP domain-containing sensor histidine kinase [Solirubrobacteraceae bacterium]|jgi:signal transduction histidine kinase|nr:HAMP domain-containing sensor histidine kinase [Solirubrobacteraceae bacterium]
MSRLPGHGAFGLRGRIVGVVLITAVATLAVAALTLLGPLEQSLRNGEKTTLKTDLSRKGALSQLVHASLQNLPTRGGAHDTLIQDQAALAKQVDARFVDVLRPPGATGDIVAPTRDPADEDDSFNDVRTAFRSDARQYTFGFVDGQEYARAAIPFINRKDHQRYVLAVRKSIGEIPDVVRVVRRAFFDAALAGLALTLILGIPLSGRLVRRLRRLREAALEVAHGGPTVEVPVDRAHDEVGDLARTLATMQRRLLQQEEARRAFVSTASHELRTPLTSLDGMLELLRDDLSDEDPDLEDARAVVERAHAQSRRLGRLAADLLDLSRIDAQVQLRSELVELGELSRAVLAEFEVGTERGHIRSALDELDGAVWALGDPGSIAQILRILLDNAVRASPPGSAVRVVLKREPLVTISVCDEGPGVRPDEREAIFERFHRGRDTSGKAGFGLGLAIGRELAERMGGALYLADGAGCGATFTLRLPGAHAPDNDPVAVA